MGDLSAIMPVIHPYMPGASGASHGSDYKLENPQTACIDSAKVQLIMLSLLLSDQAKRAHDVLANKHVPFASKEAYFERMQELEHEGDRLEYGDNGEIRVLSV
jgi:hypothetical protein